MERIEQRSMTKFVMSSLLNFGIGLVFGLIVGIIATIFLKGYMAMVTMLAVPVGIAVVFSRFTTNMYRLYFYYRLSLDVNALCEGDGEETESFLITVLLSIATLGLYRIYWVYRLAARLRANAPRYGYKMLETGKEIAALDMISFGFVSAWELIKNTNRLASVYNSYGLAGLIDGGVQ